MSKLEIKIAKLLESGRISYQQEVSFSGLTGFKKKPLRFDFGIYNQGKLVCLIEADGQQHFDRVNCFHKTLDKFKQAKERDRIKNAYCLKHGIPLIRIPYWDYDILTLERILTEPSYKVVSKFHNDLLKRR